MRINVAEADKLFFERSVFLNKTLIAFKTTITEPRLCKILSNGISAIFCIALAIRLRDSAKATIAKDAAIVDFKLRPLITTTSFLKFLTSVPIKIAITGKLARTNPKSNWVSTLIECTSKAIAPAIATRLTVFTIIVNACIDAPSSLKKELNDVFNVSMNPVYCLFAMFLRNFWIDSTSLSILDATETIPPLAINVKISLKLIFPVSHSNKEPRLSEITFAISVIIFAKSFITSPMTLRGLLNPFKVLERFSVTFVKKPLDSAPSFIAEKKSPKHAAASSKPSIKPFIPSEPRKSPIGLIMVATDFLSIDKIENKPLEIRLI